MLILSRKEKESIRIGDDITVTILGHERGHIKIGIDAPRGVAVHREEIWQKIQDGQTREEHDREVQIEMAYQQHQAALAGGDA